MLLILEQQKTEISKKKNAIIHHNALYPRIMRLHFAIRATIAVHSDAANHLHSGQMAQHSYLLLLLPDADAKDAIVLLSSLVPLQRCVVFLAIDSRKNSRWSAIGSDPEHSVNGERGLSGSGSGGSVLPCR